MTVTKELIEIIYVADCKKCVHRDTCVFPQEPFWLANFGKPGCQYFEYRRGKMTGTKELVKKVFGLNPETVGNRFRGYWIIDEPDPFSMYEKTGYLCVNARDGGSNEPDCTVGKYPNYVGTETDDFDCTYRHYYFKPLEEKP